MRFNKISLQQVLFASKFSVECNRGDIVLFRCDFDTNDCGVTYAFTSSLRPTTVIGTSIVEDGYKITDMTSISNIHI